MYEIALQSSNTNKYVYSLSQNRVLGASEVECRFIVALAYDEVELLVLLLLMLLLLLSPQILLPYKVVVGAWAVVVEETRENLLDNLPFLFMKCSFLVLLSRAASSSGRAIHHKV